MYELIRVCGGKGNREISEVFDISEYLGDFNLFSCAFAIKLFSK